MTTRRTKHNRKRKTPKVKEIVESEEYESESEESSEEPIINERDSARLKKKLEQWMDYDDNIKKLNVKTKKYKDAKNKQEEMIMNMIEKFKINDTKINIHGNDNKLRGKVYRYKSVTKVALKEDIIKDVLMETIRSEKTVVELLKKIDDRRPIKERYYLKRTKGNKT